MNKKTFVIDASAVINGFIKAYPQDRYITSPAVARELGERSEVSALEERIPKKEFLEITKKKNSELNDNLSSTDIGLVALALEFNAPIATDDYGIQNIAKKLGIEFVSIAEEGIKKVLAWGYYCPACKKKYVKDGICDSCGSKIKRKPIK